MAGPTVTWRIRDLHAGIGEAEDAVRARVLDSVGLREEAVRGFRIARRSLDARPKGGRRSLRFALQADVVLEEGSEPQSFQRAVTSGRVVRRSPPTSLLVEARHPSLDGARVAVVGSGPAGLFAALVLSRNGVAVDVVDRGAPLPERGRAVVGFLRTRVPDPETNLLYGEGGAGTYSDGKLYTRTDHPLEVPLLDELIAAGAPAEIAVDARAHIGTDRLHRILPRMREALIQEGVRFHWHTRATGWDAPGTPRRVRALRTSAGELETGAVVLAPGHSARDSLTAWCEQGLQASAKPFQFGVRIEHPQDLITRARHGDGPEADLLGPAYYSLVCKAGEGQPAAHSFCMCPGGQIVASVNVAGFLCTNGMSNSRHSSPWANAALVVTLGPREYGEGTFAGVRFQEQMESAFFEAGGGDYRAPAQRASDFLAGRESRGDLASSFKLGTTSGRIDSLLPTGVRDGLRRALERFDRSIPGFAGSDGLLVGVESRSSGPIRLDRDDSSRVATGFMNLFPVGEGAGYAGGIMSAAIDGARSAQALLVNGIPR